MDWIFIIIVGAIAGWIASQLMKGKSRGLLVNAVLGVAGAIVGRWVFEFIGLYSQGLIGDISTAVIGAVLILYVANRLKIKF